MIQLRRGPRVDEALTWLVDKPLPEDTRWDDGAVLGDVLAIERVNNEWKIDTDLSAPDLPSDEALEVLREEVEDGIAILNDIAGSITPDQGEHDARASIRVLQRLLERLQPANA